MKYFSLFPLCAFILISLPATAAPIKRMGGWRVVKAEGSVPRTHELHDGVLDVMHGDPLKDPSAQLSDHLALKRPVPQMLMTVHGIVHPQRYDRSQLLSEQDPASFDLFRIHQSRYTTKSMRVETSPALVNSNYEFKDISDRKFGFCWGFATLNRFFSQIAFFDETAEHPAYQKDDSVWFNFYKSRIDQILAGKPQVIPGFKNYREFTLVPEIEFYLKLKTMELWSNRAVTKKGLASFYNSTIPLSNAGVEHLLLDLEKRLARAELPKIIFTALNSVKLLGGATDIHVVLVTGVERMKNGEARIKIWDSNFYAEEFLKEPKFIEVRNAKGVLELHFEPWYEVKPGWNAQDIYESTQLGQVTVTPENDAETVLMLRGLKAFCAENSRLCSK